jgi:hypothetical protein
LEDAYEITAEKVEKTSIIKEIISSWCNNIDLIYN